MGIRFRCPNGHKIHVKAFLAGKRGRCPECGVSVQIPPSSTAEFAERNEKRATRSTPSAAMAAPRPSAAPVDPDASLPSTSTETASAGQHPNPNAAMASGSSAASEPPGGKADPISESPQAKWFVRPPTGGQYGPATGPVMRSWLAEGRVTAESFVWREGWVEWRPAEAVFGTLLAAGSAATPTELPAIAAATHPKSAAELYRRRSSHRTTLAIVGLLVAACLVLSGALVYVVLFMKR